MGYWGVNIFENDAILDELWDIEQILGVSKLYPVSVEAWGPDKYKAIISSIRNISKNPKKLVARLKCKIAEYDGSHFGMAFASIWITTGVKIPEELGSLFLKSCDADQWASEFDEPNKRTAAIDDLRQKIKLNMFDVSVSCMSVESEGLFAKILSGMHK